jgi:CTP synthase
MKYVFVTGGVVSGLGKGVTASSLGRLLKARGMRVTMQKFDPYLNIDPGTMSPCQHGEVFVTDDGAETDLDLGHYERFVDELVCKHSNVTTGQVYQAVINRERAGGYFGATVQVIPHITDEIQRRIYQGEGDITIVEVGGTVGDIESQPFLEAIRQFKHAIGRWNAIIIHVSLIPYIRATGELKTKPTQMSVKSLQNCGLWPDVLVMRCEHPIDAGIRDKLGLFCSVPSSHIIQNLDVPDIYELPLALERENFAGVVCQSLRLPCPDPDLSEWTKMVRPVSLPQRTVNIALVGKYVALHDAYLSVVEALNHAGIATDTRVNIQWIDASEVDSGNVAKHLDGCDGLIVPGGFGDRGIEGMIVAIGYARKKDIPFLGLCLGMQVAVVEFARNVLGLPDANSIEFDLNSPDPVIHLMETQTKVTTVGGSLRRGSYPCILDAKSKSYELYGETDISERHRHRYELNNKYREMLDEAGMKLAGMSPDGEIVEMIELANHRFFIGTQAHPEFKSRPNRPHPLFKGFVRAGLSW